MKFLCDVHITYRLIKFFESQNIEAKHVNDLPKRWNTPDQELTKYADENDFV